MALLSEPASLQQQQSQLMDPSQALLRLQQQQQQSGGSTSNNNNTSAMEQQQQQQQQRAAADNLLGGLPAGANAGGFFGGPGAAGTAGGSDASGAAAAAGAGANERMLLELLQRQQQQQQQQQQPPQYDAMALQELQRQALARELAEREHERNLLQRLYGFPGGAGASGLFGGGLDPATRLALLGGGAAGFGGFPGLFPGAGVGPLGAAAGLGRAPPAAAMTFDDSITLEARSKQAFPLKLYRMLERAERNGQDNIISFIDDGKAFAIHKPRAFETDIMPSYFNSHRMSSFQRQLNIYGFERINDGIQKGAYRHKYFIKGQKDLLEKIKRPQKLRPSEAAPATGEDDEEAAKHLVGLSKGEGGDNAKVEGEEKEPSSKEDNKKTDDKEKEEEKAKPTEKKNGSSE